MNELGIAKVRGVLRRRKVPILLVMLTVLGISATVISQLEPGYRASAVIRAAEVQPAKEYVAPTVAEQIGERLKSLRLAVMARPILGQAAQELDLFREFPQRSVDEVIDNIRSRMDVKVEGEDTFLLIYADAKPARARAIVNKVAELFMRKQVERRKKVATATTSALRSDLDSLRPEMEASERAVREFKLEHYGALPEQQEVNLRTLDQTTMEVNIQSTNLDLDLERRRLILAASASPLRHQEETLANLLNESRTKYTEGHPEVQRIQAQYENVKTARIADEKDLHAKARRNNPELVALDNEIVRARSLLEGLRTRQAEVRERVADTAKNGQALAVLTSRFESIRDKYTATLSRLRDAELAERLEADLAAMRFDLVEDASLPTQAVSPNRPLLSVAALIVAVVLSLGCGFAIDAADTSIRDPEQLQLCAPQLPLLACIPHNALPGDSSSPRGEA